MKGLRMKRITENYSSLAEMVNTKIGWSALPSYLGKYEKLNWYVSDFHKKLSLTVSFL